MEQGALGHSPKMVFRLSLPCPLSGADGANVVHVQQ